MRKLLKLIKLSWKLKLSIWRCCLFDKNTDEYRLGKYYQHTLNNLKNNTKEIKALALKIENQKKEFQDRKEITNLLTAVVCFLCHLKLMSK